MIEDPAQSLTNRLRRQFPQLDDALVAERVQASLARRHDDRVQEFVELLAEREVRAGLREVVASNC